MTALVRTALFPALAVSMFTSCQHFPGSADARPTEEAFDVRALHLTFRPGLQAPDHYRSIIDQAAALGYTMLILQTGGIHDSAYQVPEPGKIRFRKWDTDQVRDLIKYIRTAGMEPVFEVKAIGKQDTILAELGKQYPELITHTTKYHYGILNPAFRFPDGRDAYDAVELPMLDNLIALFGDVSPRYLLLGIDEVPVDDLQVCATALDTTVPELFAQLLNRCTAHLLERGITPVIWGDMFLSAKLGQPGHGVKGFDHDPRISGGHDTFQGQGRNPPSTLTAMNHLDNRDKIVVADWHYGTMPNGGYASVDYFQAMGFKDVWGATWSNEEAIRQFSRYAKRRGCGGMIATVWYLSISPAARHAFPPLLNNSAMYFHNPAFQPSEQPVASFRLATSQDGDIPADQISAGAFKLPVQTLSYEARLDPRIDPADAMLEFRIEKPARAAKPIRVPLVFDKATHALTAKFGLPEASGPAPHAYSMLLRLMDRSTGYMVQRYNNRHFATVSQRPSQAGPDLDDAFVAADFSGLTHKDFRAGMFRCSGEFRPMMQLRPNKTSSNELLDGVLDCRRAAAWARVPGLWRRIAAEGMRLQVTCRPTGSFAAGDGYCALVTMGSYSAGFRLLMGKDHTFLLQFANQDQGVKPIWIASPIPVVRDDWNRVEVTLSPREAGRTREATLTVNGRETTIATLPRPVSDGNGAPLGLGVEFRPHGGTVLARPLFSGQIESVAIRPFHDPAPHKRLRETADAFPFRALHFNLRPGLSDAELETIKAAIRIAGRYKYTHVILHDQYTVEKKLVPEAAYPLSAGKRGNVYGIPRARVKELIDLCRELGMQAFPQLHSLGKVGRAWCSIKNPVIHRNPKLKDLFIQSRGHNFHYNLRNPAIYDFLFRVYDDLIDLFDHPDFFHLGFDEVASYGAEPWETPELFAQHVNKLSAYLKSRGITTMIWGDMLLDAEDPAFAGMHDLNSRAPGYTHKALPLISRDIIIADWHYSPRERYPTTKYFRDHGFRTWVCPWNDHANIANFIRYGRQAGAEGCMVTTWFKTREMIDTLHSIEIGGVAALAPAAAELEGIYRRFPALRVPAIVRGIPGPGRLIHLEKGESFRETFADTAVFRDARLNDAAVVYRWTYGRALAADGRGRPAEAVYRFETDSATRLRLMARDRGALTRQTTISIGPVAGRGPWRELEGWKEKANSYKRAFAAIALEPGKGATVAIRIVVRGSKPPRPGALSGGLSMLRIDAE